MTRGLGGTRRAVGAGLVAAALLVAGCSSGSTAVEQPAGTSAPSATAAAVAPEGFPTSTLTVTRPDGTTAELSVLVADTQALRTRGLMDVTDPGLGGHDAMVFVFAADTANAFWMKDTLLPLSIAWFGADGSFVDRADMPPCAPGTDCPTYASSGPYRYAVEVPLGGLEGLGLVEGSTVALAAG